MTSPSPDLPLPSTVGAIGVLALDHTAVAVRDLDAGLAFYRDVLGGVPAEYGEEPERGFRWLSIEYPNGACIELLAPLGERGFLQTFLDRHGEGPHHVTFLVADLHQAVERASAAGLRVVDEDYSDPAWQVAFISPRRAFGTIVQLVQTTLTRGERKRHWSAHRFLK